MSNEFPSKQEIRANLARSDEASITDFVQEFHYSPERARAIIAEADEPRFSEKGGARNNGVDVYTTADTTMIGLDIDGNGKIDDRDLTLYVDKKTGYQAVTVQGQKFQMLSGMHPDRLVTMVDGYRDNNGRLDDKEADKLADKTLDYYLHARDHGQLVPLATPAAATDTDKGNVR